LKKLFGLSILLFCLLAVASPVFAQSAVLTATVAVNPLKVKASAPPVLVGQWFDLEAEVTNFGTRTVNKTSLLISTPSDLKVRGKKKMVGNLVAGETKTVIWRARVNNPGNFLVFVEASGKLEGEAISASDSVLISATGSLAARVFRLIFGLGMIDSAQFSS